MDNEPIYFTDDSRLEPEGDVMLLSLSSGERTFKFAMPRHRARMLVECGIRTMNKIDAAETIVSFPMPSKKSEA